MWTQIRLLQSDLGPHCLPICKNRFEKLARIFSRRHEQTTFSDAGFLGILRVKLHIISGGRQPGFTTPLFVISDGIRRAYFPGASQATTSEEDSQSHIVKENEDNSVSMYEQYSNTKLLRKIQSFPELQSMGEMEDRSAMSFGKTSPELIRKEKITGSVSLLSHMAGELRSHIAVKSNELALPDKKGVSQSKREITKTETVEQVGTSTEVSSPEYVELPEDVKPKNKSFVKTFFKWSTESKVKVSDKETNFYAPTSF